MNQQATMGEARAPGVFTEWLGHFMKEVRKVIVGQEGVVERMLAALLVGGHCLLEGVPGTAKTLMVRTLARILGRDFKRIQFTPDLMPSDILGTNVFDFQNKEFRLVKGPVFTDFLLADEINRSPAKTQSALLEAMQERSVTIEGVRNRLSGDFMVFATQNPIETEGTYPLPEAQVDRFLLKIEVPYPDAEAEEQVLAMHHRGFDPSDLSVLGVKPVAAPEHLSRMREVVAQVTVRDELIGYVRRVVAATRESPNLLFGAGPRAGIALLLAAKATAAMRGRAFVTPDDIRSMAHPVLSHRLLLHPDLQLEGVQAAQVVESILEQVEVPR